MIINAATPSARRGTRSMLALVSWHIWLERNACTFRRKLTYAIGITEACRHDMEQCRIAGAAFTEHPFGDVP